LPPEKTSLYLQARRAACPARHKKKRLKKNSKPPEIASSVTGVFSKPVENSARIPGTPYLIPCREKESWLV